MYIRCIGNGIDDGIDVSTGYMAQLFHRTMLDEAVGQTNTLDGDVLVMVAHPFQYGRAESASSLCVLYGNDAAERGGDALKEFFVKRLDRMNIDDFCVDTVCCQLFCCAKCGIYTDTCCDNRYILAFF